MNPFSRGAHATRKAIDGAGLGLAIVKSLVALHDGSFDIKTAATGGTDAQRHVPAAARTRRSARRGARRPTVANRGQRKLIAITGEWIPSSPG